MALIPPPGTPLERAPRTDKEVDWDLRDPEVEDFINRGILTTTVTRLRSWAH